MEFIIVLVVIWVIYSFISSISSGSKGDSLADNPLTAKVEVANREGRSVRIIFVKGAPLVERSADISLVIKLHDVKSGLPILGTFEEFSESDTRIFESVIKIGNFNVGNYWPDWVQIGGFMDEMIIGPHKGTRSVRAFVGVFESNNPPRFVAGMLSPDSRELLHAIETKFSYTFKSPGYAEIDKDRLKTQELTVELAVITAMSDGVIQNEEGNKIKEWIKQIVDTIPENSRNEVKNALNAALEKGFSKVKHDTKNWGRGFINDLAREINPISSTPEKYDLLELCLDVIAADGKAEKGELEFINILAKKVGVDYAEFIKLKDKQLIEVDISQSLNTEIDESVGIQPDWSTEKKRKFIVQEYSKWNNRIPTLKGKQKELAQKKLTRLASAKKKYG